MKNDSPKKDKIDDSININHPALPIQYSFEASQLIKSFTKNLPFVVLILILIATMTIFDLVINLGFINILSDEILDAMIIVVSIILILFLILTVRPVLRSQKILDKWLC